MKPKTFNLKSSYAYQAYVLARTLRKDFFAICRREGIKLFPEQWFSLYFIVHNPGQSQTELATHAFEDLPSLSRTLKTLTEKGLVQSFKDDHDRRTTRYQVTKKGEKLYSLMVKTMKKERQRVLAGLTERDYKEFHRIVQILLKNMG